MTTIVEFLTARYDEIERIARAAPPGDWELSDRGWQIRLTADEPAFERVITVDQPTRADRLAIDHIALHDPKAVLADIAANRYVLDQLSIPISEYEFTTHHFNVGAVPTERDFLRSWRMLKALALPYKDHPDYRPEWTPYKYDPNYCEEHWPWPDWADNEFPGFRNHSID